MAGPSPRAQWSTPDQVEYPRLALAPRSLSARVTRMDSPPQHSRWCQAQLPLVATVTNLGSLLPFKVKFYRLLKIFENFYHVRVFTQNHHVSNF